MNNTFSSIKIDRKDLSPCLIHFTRNSDGAEPFEVLRKIMTDGSLKCSWSERNSKKTVFGSKPAVCFTEMPLFALFDYANKRNDTQKVSQYGVALMMKELFNRGARNVIYGLTGHSPVETEANGEWRVSNLPDEEQYRYMLSGIDEINDWLHEREWRWVDPESKGYLPIWKNIPNQYFQGFSPDYSWQIIVLLVKTMDEAKIVASDFHAMNNDDKYNKTNISNTYILCQDAINQSDLPACFGFTDVRNNLIEWKTLIADSESKISA